MEKDTNTISLNKLKEIMNIIEVNNVKDDEVFDFFKILKTQKEDTKHGSVLFFPTYLNNSDDMVEDGTSENVTIGKKLTNLLNNILTTHMFLIKRHTKF